MTTDEVREELKLVFDPELGINVVDLGLIYDIKIDDKKVAIDMTLTSIGCPLAGFLQEEIESTIKKLGAEEVDVEFVYDPPWSPDMVSDEVKDMLGLL